MRRTRMSYEFKEEADQIIALNKEGNEVGNVEYAWEGPRVLVINHTNVASSEQGQGLGAQLIKEVVDKAKNEDLKVKPVCSYAENQFEKKEEYQSVLQK